MSRPRSQLWWGRLALVVSLLLSACATRPTVPPPSLSAENQRSLLQALTSFNFTGRVAITGQDPVPSMKWEQQDDATRITFSAPLGLGSLQVEYRPGRLRMVTNRGEKLAGSEAENALANAMGLVPPFDSLRYWILGVPAPGTSAPIATFDADGLMQQLQQQDWTISYKSRVAVKTATGVVQLPRKLVATQANRKLTLVIDRWRIK
ncbi:MAG: lipoprotein insertase outer membrane protein LolB [Pseudomonadota bacterium]